MAVRTLILGLALAAALAGCGNLGELAGRVEQPQIVTQRQIERHPQGSPARTVLEWWRALQFGSVTGTLRHYSKTAKVTRRGLERQLSVGPEILNAKSGLRIADVASVGRHATVMTIRTQVMRHPNGRSDRVRVPLSFELVRERGQWRLADNRYLNTVLRDLKKYFDAHGAGK